MKKLTLLFSLIAGVACFGISNAYAVVPTIDGAISPGTEWDDVGYTYYLTAGDPNEAGIPDQYDIESVTLLQELDSIFGGTETDSGPGNDGIYLLIETYSTPSLVDQGSGLPFASIVMNADFNNDGTFDFFLNHEALDGDGDPQDVTVTNPSAGVFGASLTGGGGAFSPVDGSNSVIEYFIPSGSFGTPVAPFPATFVGKIVYDNGGTAPDDEVVGTLIPEPSSMMLLGGALFGAFGFRRFRKV